MTKVYKNMKKSNPSFICDTICLDECPIADACLQEHDNKIRMDILQLSYAQQYILGLDYELPGGENSQQHLLTARLCSNQSILYLHSCLKAKFFHSITGKQEKQSDTLQTSPYLNRCLRIAPSCLPRPG